MAAGEDRRAALLLLTLLLTGVVARFVAAGGGPPGEIGYRSAADGLPTRDSVTARAERLARPLGPGERIDVDRAAAEELTRLPRIGPALAQRIVSDRERRGPFGSLDGLDRVPGVGPVLLETLASHVSFSGRAVVGTPDGTAAATSRVRVNTATKEELATLPGIGPTLAAAIVEVRERTGPFRRLADLRRVPGIGARTVDRLREHVQLP
ncbi:MAG: ComEA family DNA-binding protein [Gemmatimonadales bacterium]|jgi:competence ComEA-like helix-hairpin-helix protein|nr:ComEA family DNA-binding protein [Gemmatimonadales bacterium]